MFRRTILHVLAPLTLALLTGAAAATSVAAERPAAGAAFDDQLRLNTAITVTGRDVQLGDIFSGYLSRPEKVVAQAPRPGQRLTLSAEWLNALARTYGLDWRAANSYDRAVVYQPGQTVQRQDILNAVKTELVTTKGMPANYAISPVAALPTVTVAANGVADVAVREAYFDAVRNIFSAVVEIPPGDPAAQFVSMNGTVFPVVAVPALKANMAKNTVIGADMLTILELPEDQIKADTVTDPSALVGKSPRVFLRAGFPIREAEVAQMTLVDVPVLHMDAARDTTIAEANIKMATFNAADLPKDVVTNPEQLIGTNPRRIIAAGAPVRRGDVQTVHQVRVPVAARDMIRGAIVNASDLTWVTMNDNTVAANVFTTTESIIGLEARHPIRAGQTLHTYDILRPVVVARGRLVTILWSAGAMSLTVQGQALEAGGVGDVIRVANTKSKTSVLAEVIDEHTVRVAAEQTAMR